MNILSLFDGISCGQLALKRANIKVDKYYASEVDKYAIQVALKNFPKTIELGDVKEVNINNLEKIDMLIGGSPCQSFTFAGKRNGMTTKDKIEILTLEQYLELKKQNFEFEGQSYLFWEYIRLLKETKPKYFFLENVKMEEKWANLISNILGVKYIVINSNLFSAQNRTRYYWTNIPNINMNIPKNDIYLNNIVLNDTLIDKKYHLSVQHYKAFLKSYKWKHCELNQKAKPLLATYYKQPPHCPYIKCYDSESTFRRLTPLECERLQTLPDNYTYGESDTQRYKMIGNCWTVDVISYIFQHIRED